MLLKLLPDQISKYWPIISYGVMKSLPPHVQPSPALMADVLNSFLIGKLSCWFGFEKRSSNNEPALKVMAVTLPVVDDISGTRNLLIYCLYGFSPIAEQNWAIWFEVLRKYARGISCSYIIAYTNIDRVVNISKLLNGKVSAFITFEI